MSRKSEFAHGLAMGLLIGIMGNLWTDLFVRYAELINPGHFSDPVSLGVPLLISTVAFAILLVIFVTVAIKCA